MIKILKTEHYVIIATLWLCFGVSFAAKKLMSVFDFMTGVNGALGLYSGIKGMFDARKAKRDQERVMRNMAAQENSWYRRNYYGDYLNSSAARAAIKRVEKTMKQQNEQNRARAAITGATPEYSIARNEQNLNAMDNLMSSLAAQDDARKRSVDAAHLQNRQRLAAQEYANLSLDEKMAAQSATNGLNLFQDALMGLNWGNETDE